MILTDIMKKYDQTRVMHGLTMESAELYRRGGNSGGSFVKDQPIKKTNIRVRHGEPLRIDIEISAAGGGTSQIRQMIQSDDDLEILTRAALASMDHAARRTLISDIVRSELVGDD